MNNKSTIDFSLYDFCSTFQNETVFELMDNYFKNKGELNHRILSNQAKQIAKELKMDLDDALIAKFCDKLSLSLASNALSQYMGKMDSHRFISQTRKADYVLFGDSITDWGPWYEFFSRISVANRGIGGDSTLGMLYRIKHILPLEPKKVFFLAGINDIAQGALAEEVFERYQQLIEFCLENQIKPVVQSTLFVGKRLAELNIEVSKLNTMLENYCKSNEIEYIDLNAVLSINGMLKPECTQDDLHLTALGYQKWSEILATKFN